MGISMTVNLVGRMKTTDDKSENEIGIALEAMFWLGVLGNLGMTINNDKESISQDHSPSTKFHHYYFY